MSAWLGTIRIRTLPAAASPVLVGAAIAHYLGGFLLVPAVAALLCCLLLQIGTNLANDYYDFKKGADTDERAGPTRASATGALDPVQVRNAAYGTFGAAALLGMYLVWVGGWPVLAIGVAGIVSGILYTAGPYPLAYVGLGDLFAFAFFGPVAVAGTVFVQTGTWETLAIAWGIPLGMLTAAILVVNNLRDRPTDAVANKRTLAVRLGDNAMRGFYTFLVGGAFAFPFILGHVTQEINWLLPTLMAGPAYNVWQNVMMNHPDRRALNPSLGGTAQILLGYSLFLAVGLL